LRIKITIKGKRETNVYSDELEKTILCQDRDDHSVSRFRVNVEEWETSRVCLDQKLCSVIEAAGGVLRVKWRCCYTQVSLDI
jgi:hypothetical protein